MLVVLLDALLLVSLWVVDETRSRTPATRLMRVTLDTAVTDLEAAAAEVRRRVSVEPLSVVVEDVDLVRETTRVAVRYAVPEAPGRAPDAGRPRRRRPAGGPRCSLTRCPSTLAARARCRWPRCSRRRRS